MPHYHQIALFSVMGHVITSNRSDFLLQVKIKKVVWGRSYEPAAAGGLSQAATGSVLAKGMMNVEVGSPQPKKAPYLYAFRMSLQKMVLCQILGC